MLKIHRRNHFRCSRKNKARQKQFEIHQRIYTNVCKTYFSFEKEYGHITIRQHYLVTWNSNFIVIARLPTTALFTVMLFCLLWLISTNLSPSFLLWTIFTFWFADFNPSRLFSVGIKRTLFTIRILRLIFCSKLIILPRAFIFRIFQIFIHIHIFDIHIMTSVLRFYFLFAIGI